MNAAHAPLPERARALLFANGLGLIAAAVVVGWAWFFHLLGEIVLWPIPGSIDVQIPGDSRAWRMAHMEGITQGLLLMALALVLASATTWHAARPGGLRARAVSRR